MNLSVHKLAFVLLVSFFVASAFVIDIYHDKSHSANDLIDVNTKREGWDYDDVVLYKFLNSEYYGLISIGQPAQQFKVIFDAAWGDSWVPSQRCAFTEIACMLHNRYDNSKSSTYQEDGRKFNRTSEEMELRGFVSIDDFHLPHLKVANQTFIEMTHMSWKPFALQKADGIIGLGGKSIALNGTVPFFYNMINQQLVKQKIFTFYMNRDETTDKAGRLILGNTERSHIKGNLTYLRVVEQGYWTIQMDRLTVNAEKQKKTYVFCQNSCKVILDTSANTISGPASEVERINELIGARELFPFWPYKYMVDCRTYALLPDVSFVFNGKEFKIQSKYYVQHMVYQGLQLCLSPFVPSQLNIWELGGAFLMQFYAEFDVDKQSVGIAETIF